MQEPCYQLTNNLCKISGFAEGWLQDERLLGRGRGESKKTHRSQLTFEFKMAPELIATQTVQYASKQCDLSDAEDKISAPDAAIKNGTETERGGT